MARTKIYITVKGLNELELRQEIENVFRRYPRQGYDTTISSQPTLEVRYPIKEYPEIVEAFWTATITIWGCE